MALLHIADLGLRNRAFRGVVGGVALLPPLRNIAAPYRAVVAKPGRPWQLIHEVFSDDESNLIHEVFTAI